MSVPVIRLSDLYGDCLEALGLKSQVEPAPPHIICMHVRRDFLGTMATSIPSSISRNRHGYTDPIGCSSILRKREQPLGDDATIQPDAKRPARQVSPPAEGRDSRYGTDFDPSSASSSSEDENEAPAVLESDSNPRSTKVREGKMGTLVISQLILLTSLDLQSPFHPLPPLARSGSRQLTRTLHLL